MKNILIIIGLFLITNTFAQNATDTIKHKVSGYVSLGVSVTNSSDFLTSSYAGLEGGVMYRDFGAGLVFGRGSLKDLFAKSDNINNYFVEGKVSYSYTTKLITLTPFIGYGGYIDTKHNFIEYGVGASYAINNVSLGIAFNNWDSVNYLTPNITYNF